MKNLKLNNIEATFTEEDLVMLKIKEGNEIKIHNVSFNDFCEVILAAKEHKKKDAVTVEETPIFPCTSSISCVQIKEKNNGEKIVVLMHDEHFHNIDFFDMIYKNVGVPKLLFAIKLQKNIIQSVHVVAVTDYIITKDTNVFCYPFAHVYTSSKICFGNNNLSKLQIKDILELHSIPSMFLSMPDIGHMTGENNLSQLDYRVMLEELQNKAFPKEWLQPFCKTYSQWFDSL